MRVLVVDDHPVVAEGWERIVRHTTGCEVISAPSPLAALRVMRGAPVDVLVVDLSFGERRLAGARFIARLRRHDKRMPVLVFSMHRGPIMVRQALKAGANGFVNKDAPPEEILAAFVAVSKGGRYLTPDMATELAFGDHGKPEGTLTPKLSAREIEVLGYIIAGKSYREIAGLSFLSYKTVLNLGYSLRSKLEAGSLPELVVKGAAYFSET